MLQEFPEFFFIAKLTDAAQKSLIPAADAAGSNANTPQFHQTSQHSLHHDLRKKCHGIAYV